MLFYNLGMVVCKSISKARYLLIGQLVTFFRNYYCLIVFDTETGHQFPNNKM